MRKSADAVILMQPSSNFTLLFPKTVDWDKYLAYHPDEPFSDDILEFLNALSASLLKDRESRLYPDVITFAFFCRKANLLKLKEEYCEVGKLRLGRGQLFHIAPSNVPINFGYSLVAGLLAGNANIVRVSSKTFPQVDIVIKHIHQLSEDNAFADVASRIVLVRYDRDSDAGAFFSSISNVRIIWGGDATIANIRQNSIPARSFDVCFADRYSIAVINPDSIMQASDAEMAKLSEAFYNDTFLFDQNACSAPHTIFWLKSESLPQAKEKFWAAAYAYVNSKYSLQAVMSVDKLTAFYRQAVNMNIRVEQMPDNLIVRTDLKELPRNIENFRCACGYFSERTIENLDEIAAIVSIKYQTLAYFGFTKDELTSFVKRNRLLGLDRIVPFGETTSFALTWDGYDLVKTLSREVSVK